MFGLWLDLKKSASSEQELSLALADRYRIPGVTSHGSVLCECLWGLDPTDFDALLYDFDGFPGDMRRGDHGEDQVPRLFIGAIQSWVHS
jgi:hypothetical protein